MNKWLIRLLGVFFLVLFCVFFLDSWLNPKVPPQLQQSVGDTVENVLPETQRNTVTESPQSPAPVDNPAPIELTSLQQSDGPMPVLKNLNGSNNSTDVVPAESVAKKENQNQPAVAPLNTSQNQPAVTPSNTNQNQPVVAASSKEAIWLQAGAFGEKANADKLAATLKSKQLPVDIDKVSVNGRNYHRVYVGPLASGQVSAALKLLQTMDIKARQTNR